MEMASYFNRQMRVVTLSLVFLLAMSLMYRLYITDAEIYNWSMHYVPPRFPGKH